MRSSQRAPIILPENPAHHRPKLGWTGGVPWRSGVRAAALRIFGQPGFHWPDSLWSGTGWGHEPGSAENAACLRLHRRHRLPSGGSNGSGRGFGLRSCWLGLGLLCRLCAPGPSRLGRSIGFRFGRSLAYCLWWGWRWWPDGCWWRGWLHRRDVDHIYPACLFGRPVGPLGRLGRRTWPRESSRHREQHQVDPRADGERTPGALTVGGDRRLQQGRHSSEDKGRPPPPRPLLGWQWI